jgi:hypothetical protein
VGRLYEEKRYKGKESERATERKAETVREKEDRKRSRE